MFLKSMKTPKKKYQISLWSRRTTVHAPLRDRRACIVAVYLTGYVLLK